jgi:hypothetical protein
MFASSAKLAPRLRATIKTLPKKQAAPAKEVELTRSLQPATL